MLQPIIEYRDVHKRFDAPVLRGVNLCVERGEILAIVGPSGTGKSVLLKTTIGLVTPDRGDVLVAGRSVTCGDARAMEAIRTQTGYVFQHAALFDSLNVFENVALGLPVDAPKTLGKRALARRVAQALEDVNLDPAAILGKLPAELSGGMRKRVGIARAIVGQREILLYDEPVTGLDPVNTAAIDALIVQIARGSAVTSVIVTHDVDGVLTLCDRIALLEGGKLRFLGDPAAFRASREELVMAFAHRKEAAAAALRLLERR